MGVRKVRCRGLKDWFENRRVQVVNGFVHPQRCSIAGRVLKPTRADSPVLGMLACGWRVGGGQGWKQAERE